MKQVIRDGDILWYFDNYPPEEILVYDFQSGLWKIETAPSTTMVF